MTVIVLFLLIYGSATVALAIAEHHVGDRETDMFDLMFEAMSALATPEFRPGSRPR